MTRPVLIAGAGPVGLTMACELARFGLPVRIVDKAPARTDKSKALAVWPRTLELLERTGCADVFAKTGLHTAAANIRAGHELIAQVSFGDLPSRFRYVLMIPQSETERLLDERLQKLGVSVQRQVELVEFKTRDDGVDARLRHADGREESVSADWLVGCDGAHSAVRHGLNAPFSGETMDSDWMLADVHMRGYPCPDTEASVYWHRDGAFIIFPISSGLAVYILTSSLVGIGQQWYLNRTHPLKPTDKIVKGKKAMI